MNIPNIVGVPQSVNELLRRLFSKAWLSTIDIKDDAIKKDKIAADVAGSGLGQNADGSLEVNVDDTTIEINTDALRVKTSGLDTRYLQLSGGSLSGALTTDAVINVNAGIKFPAVQVTSSDVNTLDDYEEGTWTAGFTASTSGTITVDNSYKTGVYTKIGRQVTITGLFIVSSVSSPVGNLYITGLPFVASSGAGFDSGVAVLPSGLAATATTTIVGRIVNTNSTIDLFKYSAGSLASMAGDVQAGSSFRICVTYFV